MICLGKIIVSVIVPTLNEEKSIYKTLKLLDNQSVSRDLYEIIVPDSSSFDNTVGVAKKIADKVVVCQRKGAGFGRNFGAKHAKGEILGFVDADTHVSETWVEGLIEELKKKGRVCCTGPLENIEKESLKINLFYKWWNLQSRASIFLHYPICPGFNFGASKKEFWQAGGFSEMNTLCEDMELSLKLGKLGKVGFNQKMFVKTSARRQMEIPIHKHVFNAINFVFTKKSMSWDEYRKDFSKK